MPRPATIGRLTSISEPLCDFAPLREKQILMKNDLSTDDNLLASAEPTPGELAREFVHPGYNFKGEPLKPYTAGTDLLFTQVLDRNDATMTAILSFIFIHRSTI